MSEVVYEVTLTVEPAVQQAYEGWLVQHIDEMLTLPGFLSATWGQVETDDPRLSYVVSYVLRDRAALDRYLADHAERMRGDGAARFAGRFTATRRILTVRQRWRP